jgi:hypothetical protein
MQVATTPSHEARHVLDPLRAKHRESLVWVVPSPDPEVTAFVYTWVNAEGLAGAALAVFGPSLEEQIFEKVDQVQVPAEMAFDVWEVGPLKMSLAPDGMGSQVSFSGTRVEIDLQFEGFHAAYEYGTHPQGCPSFFADDRVEQSGLAVGTLRVDDHHYSWRTPAQRDHSWGDRDWGVMHHMKWVNALTDDGQAVHAVEILAMGQRYLRGYVHVDDTLAPLKNLELAYDLDENLLHTSIDAVFTDELDRSVSVRFTDGGPHFVWDVNPRLTLRDTAMLASIDGTAGVGYVDMSWHPEYLSYNASLTDRTTRIES